MKKKDFILIFIILLIVLLSFGVNQFISNKNEEKIEIYVNNKLYKTYNMDDEDEIKIKGKKGYNIVKIHNHGVEMAEASCPDKVCIHEGFITKTSESIVCLPNRVHIKITGYDNNDEDVIAK